MFLLQALIPLWHGKLQSPYVIFYDGQNGHYEKLTECQIDSDYAISVLERLFAVKLPIMSREEVLQFVEVESPYFPKAVLFAEPREPPLYFRILSYPPI
jgi:hypothetical protein